MSKYHFKEIEAKWQEYWAKNQTFKAYNPDSSEGEGNKPKYYVLDMFPYPSGAGLHVGHPLGYIASDIYSRYKRHQGFNVLHPMGYDSFGLPAEQYAIQTGQHPAKTTEENIARYREQLDKIGFSFDWSREVRTSNPEYYKWTQWIFLQLFDSWYDNEKNKARSVEELRSIFSSEGNKKINAVCDEGTEKFTASEWLDFSETRKQEILLKYRLTYLAETEVNWCPQLGTVLANDEIVNGVSERGGFPVIRKKMKQWSMRITAYAQRLLDGLEDIDWPQQLKDSQTNWIGRSKGASVKFPILTFPKGEGTRPGYMTGGNNSSLLLERAKDMRNKPTEAEAMLWECLKSKKLEYKFRRQHLVDDYIADFVCLSKKLVIEVDGGIHENRKEKDETRTSILNELGYRVIRFTNEEVLGNIDKVLDTISKTLEQSEIPPLGVRGISVFTTRPDTIFGVSFMVLAPEHDLVSKITTPEQKEEVEKYIEKTAKRSERERMADVKSITGVFTGAYAEHPFTGEPLPIWIGDYVLAGYGTGAVMSVPCGDQRDYDFAKHFNIPIPNIFKDADISEEAYSDKENTIITNSDFLDGLNYQQATDKIIAALEEEGIGKGKINYRLRDAVFSRQRYWGEPFPIYYKDGMPQAISPEYLPLRLPEVEKYLPTETGEPPLGRADNWSWDEKNKKVVPNVTLSAVEGSSNENGIYTLELNTMPGWAGSSWYLFRYMEPGKNDPDSKRDEVFASKEALDYWQNVDLYIGGSEHATGHLLYSRFWVKFLHDRGLVPVEEPFKKLINQGMILGESAFVHFYPSTFSPFIFISEGIYKSGNYIDIIGKMASEADQSLVITETDMKIHADVSFVDSHNNLYIEAFKNWREEYKNAIFILEDGSIYEPSSSPQGRPGGDFKVSREVEKMSKSKYNVVNPDEICEKYGADTLRMYEMFLGPLEQAKPWNMAGITGVHGFLKKLWKLYHSGPDESFYVTDTPPEGNKGSGEDLKILHKTIKKVQEDIENFHFNTSVSTFMIAVNELTAQKCTSREVLEPLAILISPYAPHIAEELWQKLGHSESISTAPFPKFEEKYLVENTKEYPISFNGKMRFTLELPLDLSKDEIESAVMAHEKTIHYLEGRTPKKVIVVPGKIVNIVG
ncbi:leucine--tRNA ligase [Aequorivita sp. H23M31]|uniref:Leucine--tRNA ligase n=1 Tax=Aequorivita ciconiae TaxID=2494375 RepID=A0A410G3H7_9FLAO|nr:DUF559 domain-containing protein [Aequorivita sp. H23M31]QAA81848.1 leucine--tRNA ligase [Aequorivita sp. H23M31]